MTKREFLNEVITNVEREDLVEFATVELEKMDARNAARKDKPSKKSLENAPIIEAIKGVLTDEPQTASDIAGKVEISTQKASALLRQIGGLTVTEVKTKKGKVKGYSLQSKWYGGHHKSHPTFKNYCLPPQDYG